MSKHTPGPWRVGDAGFSIFGPPNGTPSPETIATVKNKSHARLIAAAPEMLSFMHKFLGEPGELRLSGEHLRQIASAIIAKAEGNKP